MLSVMSTSSYTISIFPCQFPLAEVKKRLQEEKEKLKKMDPNAFVEDDEGSGRC